MLFDIDRDMNSFDVHSDEYIFYEQQKIPSRTGKVSTAIDEDYEVEMEKARVIAERDESETMVVEDESDDEPMSEQLHEQFDQFEHQHQQIGNCSSHNSWY